MTIQDFNITEIYNVIKFIKEWFDKTPVYPTAYTKEGEKSRDNALAKAEIAWRLCFEGKTMKRLLVGVLSELEQAAEND